MGHSKLIKQKVIKLRMAGFTLNKIQNQTKLPKTTIYEWIRTVPLSEEQVNKVKVDALAALQEGRIRTQKEYQKKMRTMELTGINAFGELTKRDLLIAGIALYWAEGFKSRHEHRLGFCNSDPGMVRFYLRWLTDCLKIDKKDITLRVSLNISYKNKVDEIEKYWSVVCDVPREQFTKPFYQVTVWKKSYDSTKYYGVLRIHVKKSLQYLHYMKGLIIALQQG